MADELRLAIPADHPAFADHFPGQPLLPGVSLLSEVLQAMLADAPRAARLGPAPRIAQAKFLAPVRPGAQLRIDLSDTARGVRFRVHITEGDAERTAASGEFEAAPPLPRDKS